MRVIVYIIPNTFDNKPHQDKCCVVTAKMIHSNKRQLLVTAFVALFAIIDIGSTSCLDLDGKVTTDRIDSLYDQGQSRDLKTEKKSKHAKGSTSDTHDQGSTEKKDEKEQKTNQRED